MTRCDNCSGMGTVTASVDTGVFGTGYFREDICEECDGEGEVETICLTCDQPLRDDGWCASCEDWQIEVTDLGGGIHRVAA